LLKKEENSFGGGRCNGIRRGGNNPVYENEILPDSSGLTEQEVQHLKDSSRPILITGATGTLGSAFARICSERHLPYRLVSRKQLDITDPLSIEAAIQYYNPWAVINTAGYVKVDEAEKDADTCQLVNAHGALWLGEVCQKRGIQYLTFSSDLVFDGAKQQPYLESDPVKPLNVYGQSKARAEQGILATYPEALVVRTSAFFGPWDNFNFLTLMAGQVVQGNDFLASEDMVVSPTYVPDLVHACLDLLLDEESGVWHLNNPGEISWYELARKGAEMMNLNPEMIRGVSASELQKGQLAVRPRYSALSSERGFLLPPLENALWRYADLMKQSSRIIVSA
jgi:dTDP-4-dehydrorhamnose reductase